MMWMCVSVVLLLWPLLSDKQWLSCYVVIVDGLDLLNWSRPTPFL